MVVKIPQFELIREWAQERGLYDKGDPKTQFVKLCEEQGELARGIIKDDVHLIKDSIGDMLVVLINLSKLVDMKYDFEDCNAEDCLTSAYDEIKARKGSMINGSFVKDN